MRPLYTFPLLLQGGFTGLYYRIYSFTVNCSTSRWLCCVLLQYLCFPVPNVSCFPQIAAGRPSCFIQSVSLIWLLLHSAYTSPQTNTQCSCSLLITHCPPAAIFIKEATNFTHLSLFTGLKEWSGKTKEIGGCGVRRKCAFRALRVCVRVSMMLRIWDCLHCGRWPVVATGLHQGYLRD